MRKNINESTSNGYKIICVDDEAGILDSLSVFLKHDGYQITGVTDPLEAIELVKKEHFDLMLLDFIMTPIHGDQVVGPSRMLCANCFPLHRSSWLSCHPQTNMLLASGGHDRSQRHKYVQCRYAHYPHIAHRNTHGWSRLSVARRSQSSMHIYH